MVMQRDPRTYKIIGIAMDVHSEIGFGFLEEVYHEVMALDMTDQKVPFLHEVELPIFYKGRKLKKTYRADFVCFDSIIVELKAIKEITDIERAQILNYLKATGLEIGLLINFGASSLQYERFINTKWRAQSSI